MNSNEQTRPEPLTDEQRVKDVYPDARVGRDIKGEMFRIITGVKAISKWHSSPSRAWSDTASRLPAAPQPSAEWSHIANEWADATCNGIQWIKNIRDGISKPEDALKEMTENHARIQALARLAPPVSAEPEATQGVERDEQFMAWVGSQQASDEQRAKVQAAAAVRYKAFSQFEADILRRVLAGVNVTGMREDYQAKAQELKLGFDDVACPQSAEHQADAGEMEEMSCGHLRKHLVYSAETGEKLFCELCNAAEMQRDRIIEEFMKPLQDQLRVAQAEIATLRDQCVELEHRSRDADALESKLAAIEALFAPLRKLKKGQSNAVTVRQYYTAIAKFEPQEVENEQD